MATLRVVPSVKFEILIPVAYLHPTTGETLFVQPLEIARHLQVLVRKYKELGGYTMSNPHAPPPFAGAYQGGPQERSFAVTLVVPDNLLNQATQDVQALVSWFQDKYNQEEIFAYSFFVNRYVPTQDPQTVAEGQRRQKRPR